MRTRTRTTTVALSGLLASVVALSGCGSDDSERTDPPAVADPLAVTYDGGIYLLDPNTLATTGEVELAGFNRLNPAGDDRHLLVSTKDGFQVLDAVAGRFTGVDFPAAKPGHVVRHAGRTVLFADGSGEITSFDPTELADGKPETEVYKTPAPHHGVAVELAGGELVVTVGTEESRVGLAVLDADRKEIARNEDCPGVHGEATAQGEAVVVGCQTGALVYRDGTITKVTSPTPYGRIGNQAGSDVSPIVLGDYKQDKDAELERPQQVSLIDTTTATVRLVDIGTSYTFRSLARGPQGEALVLGTDGKIHVIDPVAGTVTRTIPVVQPWQEPLEWQQARPAIFVREGIAYVTDTATKSVHRVDLASGAVTATATLPESPNELSGVLS
ncbi:zinc metallochaperone AztD [Nocardia cyriacigeorgica]|uniref:zinc metallochaperone AztD n=1 Tax=Nocardia cyriacigeorgica TaxID=135487 RepID=UPI002457D530|nr:zinc metallochaperone AztD [Nocardia cyriacigeorgica]